MSDMHTHDTSQATALAVEISVSDAINLEHEAVPELMLLEEWATVAYALANQAAPVKLVAVDDMGDSTIDDLATGSVYEYAENMESEPHSHTALVCLRITDAEEIQRLNYEFREINKPTNVLSFPMQAVDGMLFDESELMMLGDIALCTTVINDEILRQHKMPEAHWAHMVIHGVLHLQGYDHIEDDDARVMENLESHILQQLGFEDPYH